MEDKYYRYLNEINSVQQVERGVRLGFNGEQLQITAIRDDVLRMAITRNGQWQPSHSPAVTARLEEAAVDVTVQDREGRVELATAELTCRIEKKPFQIVILRADGSEVMRSSEQAAYYGELNEDFMVTRASRPGDAMYGLGQKTGRLDRQGRTFELWNTDVLAPNAKGEVDTEHAVPDSVDDPTGTGFDPYYVSIPFFYHLDGRNGKAAGFFVDNPSRANFEFDQGWQTRFVFHGGSYCEYIFAGPDMKSILEGYTWLTGRMPMPPLWALGHHQCRWTQYNEEQFRDIAHQYRSRDLPCDSLWFDINYMKDYQIFTWNHDLVPHPEKLMQDLSKDGFNVITIIDPGLSATPGYDAYDEALEKDLLCKTESGAVYGGQVWPGKTVFPDFPRPEARTWWAGRIADHMGHGLAGIWNDMNEPSTGVIAPDAMRFNNGADSHAKWRNLYAILMAEATVEGQRQAAPDKRPFVLTRAGSPGIQRYSAVWMGDNCSKWTHLWMSTPMLAGMGLSGVPFVGCDVPGFMADAEPELAVRWYQAAVFTPFLRNHSAGCTAEQYAWSFGASTEACIRSALKLRYRLLPYLYTQFYRAAHTGLPVLRPLILEFQDDPACRRIDDQFMCGDHILVAPVAEPGVTARQVYLPAGEWLDWHTGERLNGARWISAAAPMSGIPVYVRAGAVIPLWPDAPASTAGYQPEQLDLLISPAAPGPGVVSWLYEDAGNGYDYENGAYWLTRLVNREQEGQQVLEANVEGNGFDGARRSRLRLKVPGRGEVLREIKNSGEGFEETWA